MTRRRTQRERSEQTRTRLLDAAVETLVECGYRGTTTVEIARRAGVSRGGQAHHFASKQELVVRAVEHLAGRIRDDLRQAHDALPDDDAPGRVAASIVVAWRSFTGPLFTAAVELWVAARTDEELRRLLYPVERVIGHEFRSLLRKALAPSIVDPDALEDVVEFTTQLLRGLALERILTGDTAREDDVVRRWIQHAATQVAG